jgi:diguanylate cyclase (GGDEF)-like protein/PAS domain S-box-containing protein
VFFEPAGETVELVLQVSNFHHRKGGFRNNITLGMAEPVHQDQMNNWFVEAFSVGVLLVTGIYHFFIYLFRKKNIIPLYFALLCWVTMVRIGVTNQNTLLLHMPFISWSFAIRVEYLTFYIAPIFFSLFMRSLYPKDVHRWFIRAVIFFGVAFSVLMVFIDTLTLSYTVTYYQLVILLGIVYYLFFLQRIIVKRREGAIYIGLASFIIFTAVIIETLYVQGLLPFGQFTSFSFLAYILVQTVLLSSRFSRSFSRVESLSVELEDVNVSLQQSERKYRNIFEESKDMIFIAALDAQIVDVSPACEEVLGYSKEELLQMKVVDVMVHPEVRAQFEETISTLGSVRNFEVELLQKDGEQIDALVTATLRHDENGRVIGFQGSVRDITARKQAEAERLRAAKLEQIAITDPLTKVYNRRFFYEVAEKEIERAKRSRSPISIIIFDIDHFKNVNDTYGHLTGDQVLINIANLCQRNIRTMDLFARFGGEEFVILMPDTDRVPAQETAERLRELIAKTPMAMAGTIEVFIAISLGIANWDHNHPIEINTFLERADQALYQSKRSGRNRVIVWEEISSDE